MTFASSPEHRPGLATVPTGELRELVLGGLHGSTRSLEWARANRRYPCMHAEEVIPHEARSLPAQLP